MICEISNEHMNILRALLLKRMSSDKAFNLEQYLPAFYKKNMAMGWNHETTISYIQQIPGIVDNILSTEPNIRRDLVIAGFDLSEPLKLDIGFKADINNVNVFLSKTQGLLQDLIAMAELTQKAEQSKSYNPSSVNTGTPKTFKEWPVSANTTTGSEVDQEDKPYPEKITRYAFQRNLIRRILTGLGDSTKFPDYPGGLYLTAMHSSKVPGHTGPDEVLFVITDNDGNILSVDQDGKTEGHREVMFYNSRKIKKEGTQYIPVSPLAEIEAVQREMAKLGQNISRERANEIRQAQLKETYDLQEYILRNPENKLMTIITGGSFGHTGFDLLTKTPLSAVRETLNLQVTYIGGPVQFKGFEDGGAVFFNVPGIQEPVLIQKKPVPSELGQRIATILTEDIYSEGKEKLTDSAKLQVIERFMGGSKFWKLGIPEGEHKLKLALNDEIIDLNNKEKAKEQINTFFSTYFPLKTFKIAPGKFNDSTEPGYESLLYEGAVVKRTGSKGVYYEKMVRPFFNIVDTYLKNPEFFKEFRLTKTDKGYNIENTDSNYYEWLGDKTHINYKLNDQGKIQAVNSYFTYKLPPQTREQLYPSPEEQTPPVEKNPGLKQAPPKPDKAMDEFFEQMLKKGLFKSSTEKASELKATKEQIAEAKVWYEKSPLRPHLPFDQAFNIINSEGIGKFMANGITLYKGADYSDLYHEAWHGFSQMFLTVEEKLKLYDEVNKRSGSFTDYTGKQVTFKSANYRQVEEYLAEDFRKFMLKSGDHILKSSPVRNTLFRRILNFIKSLFGNTSAAQMLINNQSVSAVRELFEKLQVGNINEKSFSEANSMFDVLHKGIVRVDKNNPIEELSAEESALVVNTIDSIFSTIVATTNTRLASLAGERDSLKNLPNRTEAQNKKLDYLSSLDLRFRTNKIFSTDAGRTEAYKSLVNKKKGGVVTGIIPERRQELFWKKTNKDFSDYTNTPADSMTPDQVNHYQDILQRNIDTLDYIINEFGNPDDPRGDKQKDSNGYPIGVIAYHNEKSDYLSFQDKFVAEDNNMGEAWAFKDGNEVSVYDRGKSSIWYLIRGLHKVNPDMTSGQVREFLRLRAKDNLNAEESAAFNNLEKNMYVKNRLGFPELGDFNQMRRKITKMLADNSYEQMQETLIANQGTNPYIIQLLQNLGDPNDALNTSVLDTWSNFWATFNSYRILLPTHFLNKKEDKTYEQRTGNAAGSYQTIKNFWEKAFQAGLAGDTKGEIVVRGPNKKPYIDLAKALSKYSITNDRGYPAAGIHSGNLLQFLNDIGVKIDMNEDIQKEINENVKTYGQMAKRMWYRLKGLAEHYKEPVYDLKTLFNTKIGPDKESESGRFNDIAKLQAKYTDTFSEMVSTPTGDTRSEYSLNSSMTVQARLINSARTLSELLQGPMEYLNPDVNPWAKISKTVLSLFDENGDKRPEAVYVIKNINGITITDQEEAIGIGAMSSSADEFSKFIMDFAFTFDGTPENPRQGEKSTSISSSVRYVSPYSTNGRLWMDADHFIPTRSVDMFNEIYNSIVPYLIAEHQRVMILRNAKEGSPELNKRQLKKDKYTGYAETGKEFKIFQDLSESLKERLYGIDNLEEELGKHTEKSKELRSAIKQDFNKWWTKLFKQTETQYNKGGFIADNFLSDITRYSAKKHNPLSIYSNFKNDSRQKKELTSTLLKAYEFNVWIHNMEASIMHYGDQAQYASAVEYHKRISMFSSTGDVFRTDNTMMDHINHVMGMKYAESLGLPVKRFTKVLNAAIMEDPVLTSIYHEEIVHALTRAHVLRGKSEAQAKSLAENEAKAYVDMKIADAQGWITFDSYRALKKAEAKWSDLQEGLYQSIVKGERVDPDMISEYFPVAKYQYAGPLQVEGLPVMGEHKYSLMPLIPSTIENKPVLKALHEKMMRDGIDYATLGSGSKLSTITDQGVMDKFYNDNKSGVSDKSFTSNPVYLDFLKDQQNVNESYKKTVTISTQMRKLTEEGFMENGLPTDYRTDLDREQRITEWNKLSEEKKMSESDKYRLVKNFENSINQLTAAKKKEFVHEIGWDTAYGTVTEKLLSAIDKELKRQDISDHERSYIQLKGPDGGLKFKDLSYSLSAEAIEKTLASMINRKLVRQKSSGESLVQVSDLGMEPALFIELRQRLTSDELRQYGTNNLPFYRPGGRTYFDNGKKRTVTSASKCMVSFMPHYDALLQLIHTDNLPIESVDRLNEVIKDEKWLDINDHRRMLTLVGPRIPVQEQNSMEFEEIWEFLPRSSGNIIIHSAEIVAKTGSDFDVDKVSMMIPNIRYDDKQGRTILFKDYDNKELREMYSKYKKFLVMKERMKLETLEEARKSNMTEAELKEYNKAEKKRLKWNEKAPENKQRPGPLKSGMIYGLSDDEATLNLFNDIFGTKAKGIFQEILYMLQEETRVDTFDQFKDQMNGSKMAENEYMKTSQQLLEHPDNYANLVRPNGVYTIDPIINGAPGKEGIRDYVTDYNPKTNIDGSLGDNVSYSRLNERQYNSYVHSINKVSQEALAIAAVDNPNNVIMNRVGAHMNYEYVDNTDRGRENNRPGTVKRITINFHHNTVKDSQGRDVVSLSNLTDKDGKERISGNISQMMNLLLEIAKNDSAYYAQLKKEVLPTMLYLNQAGVPIDEIIYFASQPIVRKYMEQIRLARSPVADVLGVAPKSTNPVTGEEIWQPNFFQNKARGVMLTGPDFADNNLDLYMNNPRTANRFKTIAGVQTLLPGGIQKVWDLSRRLEQANPEAFDKDRLYNKIIDRDNTVTDEDKAVLLHWFEVEDAAKVTRDIKIRMNFDTKRSMSAFLAISKTDQINALTGDGRIDPGVIRKILEETAISSLYSVIGSTEAGKEGFLVDFLKALFPIRANREIGSFLMRKLSNMTEKERVEGMFDDQEKAVVSFFNDLMSYIFQNKLRSFKFGDYRNLTAIDNLEAQSSDYLPQGAVVINGKLSYSKSQLLAEWRNNSYSSDNYTKKGLAKLDYDQFQTSGEFFNYTFERAYLKSYLTLSKIKNDTRFTDLVSRAQQMYSKKTDTEINKIAFEEYIRDRALENIGNHKKLFTGDTSYMDQVMNTITENDLTKKYAPLGSLVPSPSRQSRNLIVVDRDLTPDMVDGFYQTLVKLADPREPKVRDINKNRQISELFSLFPTYAFLQSGLNSSGMYSMTRLVPAERLLDFMKGATDEFVKGMNNDILERYYAKWISENTKRGRFRGKDYTIDRNPQGAKPLLTRGTNAIQVERTNPNYMVYNPEGLTLNTAQGSLNLTKNDNITFVYNDAVNRLASPEKNGDGFFNSAGGPKTFGIVTRSTFTDMSRTPVKSLTDKTLDANIAMIDTVISSLKELRDAGETLAFNRNGYGQQMIGMSSDSITPLGIKDKPGFKTFMYLSQRLFEEFGYVNRNYAAQQVEATPEEIPTPQEVLSRRVPATQQEVLEQIKNCLTL